MRIIGSVAALAVAYVAGSSIVNLFSTLTIPGVTP